MATYCGRLLRIAGILAALGVDPAVAADRFVSVEGDDDGFMNDCLSMASPCRSIAHGVAEAANGDVVKVTSGEYEFDVWVQPGNPPSRTFTVSGSWTLDFTSRDPSTHGSVLRHAHVQIEAGSGDAHDITLDGLTIVGTDDYGIGADAVQNGMLDLTVQNCAILKNRLSAISTFTSGTGTMNTLIVDSIVSANRATDGAVQLRSFDASTNNLTMTGTTIEKTRGRFSGVGLFLDAHDGSMLTAALTDSVVYRNKRGIEMIGATLTLADSTVTRNRRGGIYSHGTSALTLTNVVVARNRGLDFSGGIQQFGAGSLDIVNTTIRGNRAVCESAGCAGGLAVNAGTADLLNTILFGNSTAAGDAGNLAIGAAAVGVDHSDLGDVSGSYTDGGGNISADPLLAGRNDDHLTASSPAVDTGTCTGAPGTDFEGDTRPTGGGCDMGADELAP